MGEECISIQDFKEFTFYSYSILTLCSFSAFGLFILKLAISLPVFNGAALAYLRTHIKSYCYFGNDKSPAFIFGSTICIGVIDSC